VLAAVLDALPAGLGGSEIERAFVRNSALAREALVLLVTEAAFAVVAEKRELLPSAAGFVRRENGAARRAWRFGADTFDVALEAALGALAAWHEPAELASAPEELGGLYEGLLATGVALARTDSVIVSEPRPAGGAAVERLVAVGAAASGARKYSQRALDTQVVGDRASGPRRASKRDLVARVPSGRIALLCTVDRRRSGAHYTPRELTERVVAETLAPLLGAAPTAENILALRVCDPAMGTGAFLVAACRYLAARLVEAEQREQSRSVGDHDEHSAAASEHSAPASEHRFTRARRRVAEQCLFGVDRDRVAAAVARQALWLEIGDSALPLEALDPSLRAGEALLGPPRATSAPRVPARRGSAPSRAVPPRSALDAGLDWERAFASVFANRGGFDAFVGNPPWVSYAGRAAQPLASELRAEYARYEAFGGYRNLQGLFVERCARLLRPGGRLGLVLPSSMSELAGYRPTRRAHDRLCAPDAALADLGASAFEGVFQPCMVLRSTRRATALEHVPEGPWPVERPDLDAVALGLIEKLSRPPLPAHLFGERGLQSTGKDGAHLVAAPDARHCVPLRSGSDVEAFGLKNPSTHADPAWFGARLRPASEWERVRLLVRQTARVPVAALSDGTGFRNSLLAGFEDAEHPAEFLVAYLNSTPVRWLHHARHRDARQGMPQLKIAHLRATPAPPSLELKRTLTELGKALSLRGRGIRASEQAELDELVADSFDLSQKERARLVEFRSSVADGRPRD
jgi:hypothetical protein